MIVDVAIIGIGIGTVVEVVTPSGPPNIVALDTVLSPPLQQHPKALCHGCLIYSRTCLGRMFYNRVASGHSTRACSPASPCGVLRQEKEKIKLYITFATQQQNLLCTLLEQNELNMRQFLPLLELSLPVEHLRRLELLNFLARPLWGLLPDVPHGGQCDRGRCEQWHWKGH